MLMQSKRYPGVGGMIFPKMPIPSIIPGVS